MSAPNRRIYFRFPLGGRNTALPLAYRDVLGPRFRYWYLERFKIGGGNCAPSGETFQEITPAAVDKVHVLHFIAIKEAATRSRIS
jgi:hypothetical protein